MKLLVKGVVLKVGMSKGVSDLISVFGIEVIADLSVKQIAELKVGGIKGPITTLSVEKGG